MARRHAMRALRVLFALTGVAFMAVAFARTWDGSVAELTVSWWRLLLAGALVLLGLWCAFGGWAALVGLAERRLLASGFYLSQLGKYIPGGIWQAVGQIGYTTQANVTVSRATTAFAAFAVTQAAAGGVVGSLVAVAEPAASDIVRYGALGALGLVLLLHRRWMLLAVSLVRRVQGHADSEDLVPDQRAIAVAFLWSLGTMASQGLAFAVVLGGLAPGANVFAAVAVSGLAWTVGFLALPVPSGIGVREAVMIAVLGPTVGASVAIVASVYQRLLTIAAEGVMIVVARLRASATPADVPPKTR